MKKVLLLLPALLLCAFAQAQLTCPDAAGSSLTSYSNGASNDSIFYYCSGGLGTLTVTPETGTPGWTFNWQQFDAGTNSWINYSSESNVPSSTITGLNPNGYRVTIVDGVGALVGCYRAWIVQVLSPPSVDVAPIPPSCSSVALHGTIDYGTRTPIYNPPPDPLIIDASTEITVCFTANHTFVSDLGFYLIGPPACGSPVIPLSPNPGSLNSSNNVCNSGNNVSNLCFSTASSTNLNVCTASTPLTGTYGSYGAGATPINWSPLYGCDATQPGWRVQIYDCISLDVGSLQATSITFTGTSTCGTPTTVTYTASNINSAINDNSCSAATASIYTVPPTPTTAMPDSNGYLWTANPYMVIPDSTTSLDFTLPSPGVPTVFTLQLTGNGPVNGAGCGGNTQDSELFNPLVPVTPVLSGNQNPCSSDAPYNLNSDVPGGTWSGPGITDPVNGTFDPSLAGMGTHTISYTITSPCPATSTIDITVTDQQTIVITDPGTFCSDAGDVNLQANYSGGTWSGPGITDPVAGTFNPALAGVGVHTITYTPGNSCSQAQSISITVNQAVQLNVSPDVTICVGESAALQASGADSYNWTPATGLNNTGSANPTASPLVTTTYTVTGTNTGGCTQSATVTVTVAPTPNLTVNGSGSYCVGDTVQLSAFGADTYNWSPATGLNVTNQASVWTVVSTDHTYTVIGTSTSGCTDTATVTIDAIPVNAYFTINPNTGITPLPVMLTPVSNGSAYSWDLGDGTGSTSSTAFTHTYTDPGSYIIELTVEEQGCSDSYSLELIVLDVCNLAVPNVVTVNNDGVNDLFFITSEGVSELKVDVFNRWGNFMGSFDGLTQSWDAKDLDAGTYFYKMSGTCKNGDDIDKEGFITVLK